MFQPSQDGDEELQDLGLRPMGDCLLVHGHALDFLDQTDALGKLAPGNQHGMVSEFVDHAVAHGSPPQKAAKSVAEQGSVVKAQILAEKSNSASGCTKPTLGTVKPLFLF